MRCNLSALLLNEKNQAFSLAGLISLVLVCLGIFIVNKGQKASAPNATVDLILFMGQSNMAGRGITSDEHPEPAPSLLPGAGWEYRSITAPDVLSPLEEPFGCKENTENGINDGNMKTGSMVTTFVNACYTQTQVPIVALSASKGGSSILLWQPADSFYGGCYQPPKGSKKLLSRQANLHPTHLPCLVPGRNGRRPSYAAGTIPDLLPELLEYLKRAGCGALLSDPHRTV